MAQTGITPSLFLLASTLTLLSHSQARPFQCNDLQNNIPACSCEGAIVNSSPDDSLVVINCRNLNLSAVPAVTGSTAYVIYEMTLAQNNIQAIPAEAFEGLKIHRLDLRQNRLTSIDSNAFRGLESELKELYVGAEIGANFAPPMASLTNLTALDTLHLEYFKFQNNQLATSDSLHSLTSLKSLTLSHNELTFIQSGTVPTSLTSLTLEYQGFVGFPVDVLRTLVSLESLAITNTDINTISYRVFELNTHLQSLDLGYNKISVLNDDCFFGITTSLQHLSLRNNPITSATILREIKKLTALTTLQLSEITLTSLPAQVDFLLNKSSLKSLYLEGNGFTTLGPSVFNSVGVSLSSLSLARNQLGGMDEQALAGLSALTSLDLSHQTKRQGQTLNLPKSLTSLTSLKTLKLSGTPLSQATLWQRVGLLTSLEYLRLDDTSLTSVTDYALRNLTQLIELNLDKNNLTQVTQKMMAGPQRLSKLTLNSNHIRTVSNCAFHAFSLSPALALELLENPLQCDCKLNWLLEETNASRIKLAGAEKCASPPSLANRFMSTFQPGAFTCVTPQPDTPCLELYTTPTPPATTPIPALGLSITNISMTSISIRWTTTDYPGLTYFRVQHTELETGLTILSDPIDKQDRSFLVKGLKAGTRYSVCINAYRSNDPLRTCLTRTTRTDNSGKGSLNDSDDSSSETGIIVGTVIGLLALLAIIAAILYLVLLRKRTSSKDLPAQPHVFSASELPGMGTNTKQFTRPQGKQPPKVGRAMDETIKVTVISDGHTGPTSPGARQSAGSYQFLDEKHPNPNPGVAPQGSGNYCNDVHDRPLPTAPEDSMKGYYNRGFQQETKSEHAYNQIDY